MTGGELGIFVWFSAEQSDRFRWRKNAQIGKEITQQKHTN